jgi:16S rRNA C1402 N4-methylase RsmH
MITPSKNEILKNNRSRSAKLRIAERTWKTFYHLSILTF